MTTLQCTALTLSQRIDFVAAVRSGQREHRVPALAADWWRIPSNGLCNVLARPIT